MLANDVTLIASTNVVVARQNLHPELMYLLAQTMQNASRAGDFNARVISDANRPGISHRRGGA